ncbi:MAG: glycosyltransferase family 2 protein [Candidatus Levybacteria bacterium]|nr:glycosyltransferase family 2 protein [Candidatus Levybacteria bacterium]
MDTSKPLISVIVPVYNGGKYLADAIKSVIAQDYKNFEIIVIDDGSTDNSAKTAKSYPLSYVYQTHAGLGAALNHGISLAKGDYFSFLDADDLWFKKKISRQLACFEKDLTLDMVFGRVREFRDTNGKKLTIQSFTKGSLMKGTMLIRREAFFRVGLFETKWRLGDFIDWYLRAYELKLKSYTLPNIIYERRIHKNNMGIMYRAELRDYVHILKKSLDRRKILKNEH